MGVAARRRAGHLHQLRGGDQGVRRRARRHRLHLVERRGDAASGRWAAAARRSCSCPTSTWAATPPTRWACRSTRWWCGIRTSRSAASTPRRRSSTRASSSGRATARCTRASRAQQIDAGARSSIPGVTRHRASRSAVRRRAGGRRLRLDRVHPQDRCATARAGLDLGRRHRGPPREPAGRRGGARARPSSRSTSSAACARRCSACRRTTCCGCSKGSSTAQVHNQIVVPGRPEALGEGRARPDACRSRLGR